MAADYPRIAPGKRSDIGTVNALIARAAGLAVGAGPLNIFTTIARHRRLYRAWLRFASALMMSREMPRIDTELVILRVAHNCSCDYEWLHHERLAQSAGLSLEQVARVRVGAIAPGWSDRQAALLQATDDLHFNHRIGDQVWERLRMHLCELELIELCMLVGHYEMLAMTIASLRVQPDQVSALNLPARSAQKIARTITKRHSHQRVAS